MQQARNILRWVFLVLALAYIAWTAPVLIHDFRAWRAAIPDDPVAAAFWRSAFEAGGTDIAIVLAMGILIWFALKPRKKRAAAPSAQD